MIYYLIGAYIEKYRLEYDGIKKYIFCFLHLFIYFFPAYLYDKINSLSSINLRLFRNKFAAINPKMR